MAMAVPMITTNAITFPGYFSIPRSAGTNPSRLTSKVVEFVP
jgi:hypothetical protein